MATDAGTFVQKEAEINFLVIRNVFYAKQSIEIALNCRRLPPEFTISERLKLFQDEAIKSLRTRSDSCG
jgi:hypothetical protein